MLPPHHSRFSHTSNRRIFACILTEQFLFCTIADEGLKRSQVMAFLEQVQQEFMSYIKAAGLFGDQRKLERISLNSKFKPVFRRLANPYIGMPQKEKDRIAEEAEKNQPHANGESDLEAGTACSTYYDNYDNSASIGADGSSGSGSRSPSRPLIGHSNSTKYKQKKHKEETSNASEKLEDVKSRGFERLDIERDPNDPQTQRFGSSKSFRGQQTAQRLWRRSVIIVLSLDFLVCLVLFIIWLGICRGFKCLQ
ncbi:hypothetical protein KP509_37G046400 [Ceratopteris richardii]|nr:hypothetical protein KP509_37G046400 [Ceratopteris richardii]